MDQGVITGYTLRPQEQEELTKASERLAKWTLDQLHRVMDLLDMPRGTGDKSSKIQRIVDFLKKPAQLSTMDLAAKEAKKKEAKQRARTKKAATAKKAPSARKAPAKTKRKPEEGEEEDEEEEDEEEEGEEETTPPPKPAAKRQSQVPQGPSL